ncbi:helix-turn-helix transcriptional regulator [candidate division KSB1 bacterium]|nr:helix-turn-helix transcriptional regulator [candidate division KSB1 bacterium]
MISKDLVAASARPLILSILAQGESYGYEIIQRIKQLSNGVMQWKDGMLYPVLHRLQEQGLIESEWRVAQSGRKRKYYRIKQKGRKELAAEKKQWMQVHSTLLKIWEMKPCTS